MLSARSYPRIALTAAAHASLSKFSPSRGIGMRSDTASQDQLVEAAKQGSPATSAGLAGLAMERARYS